MDLLVNYSEQIYKRRIDPDSTFLLIANPIDGFINVGIIEFKSFEDLSNNLLKIFLELECFGEWDIKIYQTKKPYKILKKYGYYKYPSNGKLILKHSYMYLPIRNINFKKGLIEIIGSEIEVKENWENEHEDFLDYEIDLEIIKIKTA